MTACLVWTLVILAGVGVSHVSSESIRIVGGQETTIDNYPAIVQVEALGLLNGIWGHFCGANILTSRYVLSAAHCFEGFLYSVLHRRIRAGSSYADVGGVVAYIRKENNHPDYGKLWADADITVVELTSSLVYSPVVQQAIIMAQNATIPYGSAVVHAGWGAMWEYGPTSPVLRHVTVYTIDTQLCKDRYEMLPEYYHVTDDMICAGVLDVGGRDACQGDSGGPLYYGNILVGIVSWGHGCANGTFPGVSARVASYTDWIVATVV